MKILVLGASARSAAYSALRAGLEPVCVDYFGDRDLTQVARSTRLVPNLSLPDRIASFVSLSRVQTADAWLYTSPLENHPEAVARIASLIRLLGNGADSLLQVRDPFRVAECLRRIGLQTPEIRRTTRGLALDGSWLVKPLASGGGQGIVPLLPSFSPRTPDHFVQKRIRGRSCSVLFLGDRVQARLLGVTRQLLGTRGNPFAYRGNLGPLSVPPNLERQLQAIGNALAAEFGLVGLFGIDFVWDGAKAWVVEINPRYTGAVEILELSAGASLLLEHCSVCDSKPIPIETLDSVGLVRQRPRIVAKWILYATRRITFPSWPMLDPPRHDLFEIPDLGDVPHEGTEIDQGEPVLTVYGSGPNPRQCFRNLREKVNQWRARLGLSAPSD